MPPRHTETAKRSFAGCQESSHGFLEVNGSVSGVRAGQIPNLLDDAGEVDRGVADWAVCESLHKLLPYPLKTDSLIRWMESLVPS